MRRFLLTAAACAAVCTTQLLASPTPISSINGFYDVDGYDTPSLHVSNTTSFDFTNVQMTLTGYQGLNQGITGTVLLPNITAGTTAIYTWGGISGVSGSTSAGNLFAYDYDDEYSGSFAPQTGYGLVAGGSLVAAPQCAPQASIYGWNYCADVGNFYVTLTAMWNGEAIYSQFSPDNTLAGAGNAAGMFVGWEGLDPNGWSETDYDSHSNGGPNGVLAYIYAGTPPTVGSTPEPASLALGAAGFALIGLVARKRRS